MRLVILESPYAGDINENIRYAKACVRDCLMRNESPLASHLLFTQDDILRDYVKSERKLGIDAGLAWSAVSEATVVYTDLGISDGMLEGIRVAQDNGKPIEYRQLDNFLRLPL